MSNTYKPFEGRVAVITGGSRGIGRSIAELLASRGADLAIADYQVDLAKSTAQRNCRTNRAKSYCSRGECRKFRDGPGDGQKPSSKNLAKLTSWSIMLESPAMIC